MTKPNAKPKKLPRRTMTMADKADDGKRNHSVTRGKPSIEPPSTHRSRATNDAHAMRRVLDAEADNTELAETVALETALEDARSSRQRFLSVKRSIFGGFDNGALILGCVLSVCAFAVVLVAIAAMYAPERGTPTERTLGSAPIIVCAQGPCTNTQSTPAPAPTTELPSVGDHTLPPDLHCPEDALILPVYGGKPGAMVFECVPVDDFQRLTPTQ
jgi:hypothetical protein